MTTGITLLLSDDTTEISEDICHSAVENAICSFVLLRRHQSDHNAGK